MPRGTDSLVRATRLGQSCPCLVARTVLSVLCLDTTVQATASARTPTLRMRLRSVSVSLTNCVP
ncbi:MAG: hypothetical protein NZ556_08375 [Fimbriimonadales bacterium]|nr:hypothetical protein [Fimbriimonadales bacterium]